MEKRVAFLFLLYLASAVSEGQIKYTAHQRVKQGQNWTIECSNYPEYAQIGWRRNGQRLAKEFESGLMYVRTDEAQRISKLFGTKADETQEGNYKCIVGSDPGYSELLVDYDFTFKTLKKSKNSSLELECGHSAGNNRAQWMKEDVVIKSSPVANFVRVHNETGKLQILKSDVEDIYGNYSCSVDGNVVTKYRVVPQPLVLLAPMTSVVEGEKMQLHCKGDLVLGARVRWLFAGKVYNGSEGRVQFLRDERNVNGGQLTVENILMDDRGDIKCMVSYNWTEPTMTVEGKTFLRVKDKYAALWPFLGICAEVTVLCAIILIYEKKRNKAELEESDTDQSPDTKPTQNKDSDVRQRK